MSTGTDTTGATRDPAVTFAAERPRLVGLAYRLLGSLGDAEDVVQETWFRWQRADHASIDRPAAWLTTVCSRIGLDLLRARRRERVEYVGPWLPEPVATDPAADPEAASELADSLTTSFLVLLERLRPDERLAVLLADVFGEPFRAVASVLGTSEPAARQLTVRARRKLRGPDLGPTDRTADALGVARRLADAVLRGDLAATAALLAPDAVLVSDGGAAFHAARRPVVTAARVARFLVNLGRRQVTALAGGSLTEATLNGAPAWIARDADGAPVFAQSVEVRGGRVTRVHVVVNPDKLAALGAEVRLH